MEIDVLTGTIQNLIETITSFLEEEMVEEPKIEYLEARYNDTIEITLEIHGTFIEFLIILPGCSLVKLGDDFVDLDEENLLKSFRQNKEEE